MALRIALPGTQSDNGAERSSVLEARERRLRLASYVEIDPAIRFVIALAIVAAISLLFLFQTSTVAAINYRVQIQNAEYDQLIARQQELELQIAAAQSLARIRDVAVNKLGMIPVGDGFRYLSVEPVTSSEQTAVTP